MQDHDEGYEGMIENMMQSIFKFEILINSYRVLVFCGSRVQV